jgi:hypothetical protein
VTSLTPDGGTPPPDREFLRLRIALVLVAIGAAVLVAWLAGPFGAAGVLVALDRMYRWLFSDLVPLPPDDPPPVEVDRPPERDASPELGG